MPSRGRRSASHGLIALVIASIALAIMATSASAATTRADYVAQVDQVCTGFAPQFGKLSRPVIKKVLPALDFVGTESDAQETRRLNRAFRALGRYIGRSARVFAAEAEQLALVTPAPGDEAAVASWIDGLRQYASLQAQSTPAWKHRRLGRVATLSEKSVEALNNGGAGVTSFGISTCLTHIDVPEVTFSDAARG
jgi:hypothetical protein